MKSLNIAFGTLFTLIALSTNIYATEKYGDIWLGIAPIGRAKSMSDEGWPLTFSAYYSYENSVFGIRRFHYNDSSFTDLITANDDNDMYFSEVGLMYGQLFYHNYFLFSAGVGKVNFLNEEPNGKVQKWSLPVELNWFISDEGNLRIKIGLSACLNSHRTYSGILFGFDFNVF